MRATVLVVENDPTTRGLLHTFLEQRGHRVLSEGEGEWALGVAEAEIVDLVVLDQRLADISGLEVLRRLRAGLASRRVPVLLVGGPYAEAPPELESLAPVTFLHKPLALDTLEAAVEALLAERAPRPDPGPGPGPVPLRGDLSRIPFARLLGRLAAARASGALLLERSATKKVAFFELGRPIFVQSNLLSESLGQVMRQEGVLDESTLERALLQMRREGRPLGDVLIAQGALSEHHLAFALERQMEIKLFDLFAWTEGAFRYRPDAQHSGPRVTLPLGPVGLVFEGAVRQMSVDRIEADLASEQHRTAKPHDPSRVRDAVLALEPGAATLLGRLDGSVPLEALFDDPELGRSEALQLVYALVVTGSLALFEPAPPVRSEDLRDRVRAQLEAEMRRIERARRRRSVPTPRPSRARPIDPEEARALAAELDAVTSRLEGQTLYQLLGASPNADEEEVRCAYREVSRELDPDRWLAGRSAPDLARRAEANHLTVVRAFQVLSDERSRRTYAAWRTDPHTQLLPELRAAELVREAEADLEAERFARAAETFHWAAEQHPKDLYPVAAGAYAAFRAGGDPEAALASIRACRRHAPDDPDCLRMEARVLVHAGRSAEAAEVYRAVLAVDPDCTEARAASGTASDGGTRGVMAKVAGGARAWFRGGSEG